MTKYKSLTPLAYIGTPLAISVAFALRFGDLGFIIYGVIAAVLGAGLMSTLYR